MTAHRTPSFRALARIAGTVLLSALAGAMAPAADAQPGAPAGCTGPASDTWLRVVVTGVRNSAGLIAVTLYADDSSRFLAHHGSLYVGRVPAVAGTTDACIFVPKPGVYALAVYHDENGNQKFDRNAIGLPAEAYGFSNNPGTLFGLPSFSSVRIQVMKSGLTSHIHLTYP